MHLEPFALGELASHRLAESERNCSPHAKSRQNARSCLLRRMLSAQTPQQPRALGAENRSHDAKTSQKPPWKEAMAELPVESNDKWEWPGCKRLKN
jgi:hypothetical protein